MTSALGSGLWALGDHSDRNLATLTESFDAPKAQGQGQGPKPKAQGHNYHYD